MGRYLLGTFVILCLALHSNGYQVGPVANSFRVLSRSIPIPEPDVMCSTGEEKTVGFICKNCNTLQYCNGETQEAEFIIPCASQFLNKKYCYSDAKTNNYTCVSENTCPKPPSPIMTCPDAGLYPNLKDCKSYYMCSGLNAQGTLYQCMFNSVYNHAQGNCRQGSSCYKVEDYCKKQFKIIAYTPDSNLYVICQGDKEPILKKCPEKTIYSPELFRCDFKCTEEGNFVNPLDPTENSFYQCVTSGKILQKVELACPSGQKFNNNIKLCAPA